ncbi:hypothetical protein [Arthrobacter sp. CG_A4]|uniref:hypothetical protein n=1 Tax=Arthrobacter sp. CG_A4 TaxID=3071706 RepID=UPI002E0D979E
MPLSTQSLTHTSVRRAKNDKVLEELLADFRDSDPAADCHHPMSENGEFIGEHIEPANTKVQG